MKLRSFLIVLLGFASFATAQTTKPSTIVNAALDRVAGMVEPMKLTEPRTYSMTARVTKSVGLPSEAQGAQLSLAIQAPDHLLLKAKVRGDDYVAARAGDSISVYVPEKKFGVVGVRGVPRFAAVPDSIDDTHLGPMKLPINLMQIKLSLLVTAMEFAPEETIGGQRCHVIKIALPQMLQSLFGLPNAQMELAVRQNDSIPARVRLSDGKVDVELMIEDIAVTEPWAAEKWAVQFAPGDTVEKTAVSHLSKCFNIMMSNLETEIEPLGPARGRKKLVGTSGKGRLEMHDGTRVLFLKGTPEEMGKQQGELLRNELRDVTDRILYGVGVESSFPKGKWFFGEIEQAHKRLAPYISDRTYREIDAMADAAGIMRQEGRLSNFFPELFHCSGFSICGDATVGGRMYHGRVLDYLKGVGLEQNAVVMVYQPDIGNAWVNCGYAGFVGTVTAMNEKGISVGEMGGRGEGAWDGKPMAQLLREVMESAGTLDEAIEIMRKGPRTCEYYYVISDGKSKQAVGIAATPTKFEVVRFGEAHPLLPDPVKDAVLLSAGDRYKKLVERVKEGYGKFDAQSAMDLMKRPVAMTSCIQAVLFAPDTLDFWVANADSKNVASHTRYTHYNLRELLKSE